MEKRKLGEVVNYKNGGSFESLVKNHGVYKLITLKSVNTEGKLCNSGNISMINVLKHCVMIL